jgi:hypothetical protein
MLTRESFFAVPPKVAVKAVEGTLWGTIHVRTLSLVERDTFDKSIQDDLIGFRARLIVMTVCTEDGTLIFRPGDYHRIGEYPYADLAPVVDASMAWNQFSKEDREALEKKARSPESDSSSDSPDTSDGASSSSNGTCPPTSTDAGRPMISSTPSPI